MAADISLTLFVLLLALPTLGFIAAAVSSFGREEFTRRIVSLISIAMLLVSVGFAIYAWKDGMEWQISYTTNLPWVDHEMPIAFQYDRVSLVFSLLTSFLGFVVLRFSSIYLHREPGYARFFSFIFLLLLGMQVVSVANNLTVFLAGWEFVGLSSFFLISFYRSMPAPVANALKVFAVYRIGDLGLLLAAVLLHIGSSQTLAALGIVLAAAVKSGQFPFSYWVPRAMEGPTPSSSIFYGALAIHAGILLLIRTMPVWEPIFAIKIAIGGLGVVTMLYAGLLGRIQSSIKGQLAYASVVQVALMFVELAMGFKTFVLFHLTMHAFWRAYQLLASPSVVADSLRAFRDYDQSNAAEFAFSPRLWIRKMQVSVYNFALQEAYLDSVVRIASKYLRHVFVAILAIGLSVGLFLHMPPVFIGSIALICGALWCSGQSLQHSDHRTCNYVAISIVLAQIAGAMWVAEPITFTLACALSTAIFWALCRWALRSSRRDAKHWILVAASCALIGVPPFPGFALNEAILEHLADQSIWFALLVGVALAMNGFGLFRTIGRSSLVTNDLLTAGSNLL